MSGESAVVASITALAAKGYKGVRLTFNAHSPWPSLIRLTVTEGHAHNSGRAIAKTVLRIDPGAIRI